MIFSAIFDLDGVITDTAQIHFLAWKKVFDAFLTSTQPSHRGEIPLFSEEEYVTYVDGISRHEGIRNFLHHRQLLNHENPSNAPLIEQLAQQKNQVYLHYIQQQGVKVFNSTVRLIHQLKKHQIKVAVITASKNALAILQRAQLEHLFDAIVDGNEMQTLCLPGKPCPDIFLEAAKRLNTPLSAILIVEDALAGIQAAHRAHAKIILGIDRRKIYHHAFYQAGATMVLDDLKACSYAHILKLFQQRLPSAKECFDLLSSQFRQQHLALFLDFDGTLTPIVAKPEQAKLSKENHRLLKALCLYCPTGIITGRELSDIKNKISIPEIFYAANHGLEISAPLPFDFSLEKTNELTDHVKVMHEGLVKALASIPGCLIENKRLTLSIHYRLVDKKRLADIKKQIFKVLHENPLFAIKQGKKVFEIRPKIHWHKGKAIRYIVEQLQLPLEQTVVMYLGDDLSDEEAFQTINPLGISILVSSHPRKTQAKYTLAHPGEVNEFLHKLHQFVSTHRNIEPPFHPAWMLQYEHYNADQQKFREALCTLSNGYFATRGAFEEANSDEIHYPATYCAGCYNTLESYVAGQSIRNEDLVNMPNWLCITFQLPDSSVWFDVKHCLILAFSQRLDLRQGSLNRQLTVQDQQGRITKLHYWRFVSLANPNMARLRLVFQAINWSGKVLLKSGLNGHIQNEGVARYQALNHRHLHFLQSGSCDEATIFLKMRTYPYNIEIAQVAAHRLYQNGQLIADKALIEKSYGAINHLYPLSLQAQDIVLLEKTVSVVTSKQRAISDCLTEAKHILFFIPADEKLFQRHRDSWKNLWQKVDIQVEGSTELQKTIRFHLFHLLQTVSNHSVDLDVSVPARGLHGEAYRGHIFWDELFIIPYYIYVLPNIVRALLKYRYRRLNKARILAQTQGLKGALYPWQSASDGSEVSQKMHLNPDSQTWNPDYSCYQRHVNGAIVYNIWHYYLATDDLAFLGDYGAEMILEIAHCWASLCHFNTDTGRYEIHQVVGPDEYHDQYPDSDLPGINNNAYTNVLAVWSLERALKVLHLVPKEVKEELLIKLSIDREVIHHWQDITHHMTVPFHDGIISQFEGYERLAEFPWSDYQQRYPNIERLDRILNAEGHSVNAYKVSKQADVLMLFYLFSQAELKKIFLKLRYPFDESTRTQNIHYYMQRTCHGSTLSKAVLAYLYTHVDSDKALSYFNEALHCDIVYSPHTTTHEGLHFGAMALCINTLQRCFLGLRIIHRTMNFEPRLPPSITRICCQLHFRTRLFKVMLSQQAFEISLHQEAKRGLHVIVHGLKHYLQPGMTLRL